ncbi:MAG: NAD-dependent epimerase/dehydratase family protein [Actinophytocola sp.]|uniref:NAD-dependent epimerase/dehydratase family protein n=1 Tax=Actinophytocola sp. TaxID=1872138 RepID=UPI00132C138C|nr:NAD-dependent epimerase/dehydratase family protein [Actinophytocola sp.]MPZ84126.1 NAD-dependent epimerase/dehydratase family protein [Actinophytocola sp.]
MAPKVLLVTGVADHLGGRLAARLAANPDIDRVLGVDTRPPATGVPARVEFVAADIRNPRIAKVISSAKVDTVVHAAPRASVGPSRSAIKERNVIGTMQLLAACKRSPRLRKLVVKSTAEVYGASATSPAVFTEQDPLAGGRDREPAEIEAYVRGFARRRPDVALTTMRLAELIGPGVDTALARYFRLPVVPTVLGFDARVQLLHPQDAVAALERATVHDLPGVFNVGGDGVILLSQAVRRAGRVALPMLRAAIPAATKLVRGAAPVHFSPDLARLLNYGRVIDTTRLKTTFGFAPRWSTAAAFDDYVRTAHQEMSQ